jgi:hypothetical protein
LPADFQNTVVLSSEFYNEVKAHPIPADLDVVREFTNAPAVLDLFMWLAYRCYVAEHEEEIPLFGPFGLVKQLGSTEYKRERRFREKLEKWLQRILAVWPECPAAIIRDGQALRIAHAAAIHSQPVD